MNAKWVPYDEGYIDNNALYVALAFMNRRKILENKIKKTTTTTTVATATAVVAPVIKLFKSIIDQRPVQMDYYEIFNLQGRPTIAKQSSKIKRNKATAPHVSFPIASKKSCFAVDSSDLYTNLFWLLMLLLLSLFCIYTFRFKKKWTEKNWNTNRLRQKLMI